jgi:hypothetical protein
MAAVHATTYRELYLTYPAVNLALFNAIFEGGTVPAPAVRLNQFLSSSDDTAKVLVYLGGTVPAPRVLSVHGLFKFAPSLAGASQWDDNVFGLHDDVSGGHRAVTPLALPNGVLNRTAGVHVPVLANLDAAWAAALAADATSTSLGPYVAGDPNTESVTTRFVTGVPNQYVELVLSNQDCSPRTFWTVVIGQIITDGNGAACSALVNWARVACTLSAANVNVLHGHAPQPFLPDLPFRQRIMAKLDRDLPVAVVGGATAFPDAATQAITNLCTLQAAKVGKKTVKEYKKGLYEVLCKFMGSADEADFPPFWAEFATTAKGDRIALLQGVLVTAAEAGNQEWAPPTPALVEVLAMGSFASRNADDLMNGLTVFHMDPTEEGEAAAHQLAYAYESSYSSGAKPSLGELLELKATKAAIPRTVHSALQQLKAYSTLIGVLFGTIPFVGHLADFVDKFGKEMGSFENTFSKVESVEGMLGRFLMKFHILTRDFLYRRLSSPWDEIVALPMYQSVIHAYTLREWATLPFIPATYLKPKAGEEGKKKKSRAEGSTTACGSTNGPAARATRLQNTSHVTAALVTRFTTWGRELNTVTSVAGVTSAYVDGTGRAPENQVCLSYHLRKFCYAEGCRRAASHRQLTPSEVNAVAQFMTDVGIP